MKHFTVSAKGRKGYYFDTHKYQYILTVPVNGKDEEFIIYADNRQAAITTSKIIVQSEDMNKETNRQNALQQLHVAYGLLETMEDKEKVKDYIRRIKERYNIMDDKQDTQEVSEVVEEPTEETTIQTPVNNETQSNTTDTNTYTAFNRSFSSYDEAYNYCVSCDYDPSFIEVVEPFTASDNNLALDLQLFAAEDNEETKTTFKKPYATYNNGMWQAGIGKHFELVYIIETTKTDTEIDAMFYSNIHKYECNNIQSAIECLNRMQRQGWHNIQIMTQLKYKNKPIIEDSSECSIELDINTREIEETNKDNKKLYNSNNELLQELEIYKEFISKYKADKTFEEFKNNKEKNNNIVA